MLPEVSIVLIEAQVLQSIILFCFATRLLLPTKLCGCKVISAQPLVVNTSRLLF